MAQGPYTSRFGAIHYEGQPGFLFTVSGDAKNAVDVAEALNVKEALGWRKVAEESPAQALTLLFKAAPDADGCEIVWLGLSGDNHPQPPVLWAYLPDVLNDG